MNLEEFKKICLQQKEIEDEKLIQEMAFAK